ncbi:MAG TPA: FAD-dependent oxidoreductase [Candidatus Binatia bacterium]|nr:FAD-dependent oxidoreductase [Candidatus Binatia bacterium]
MAAPILHVTHDDEALRDALRDALARRYEPDYRVHAAPSADSALRELGSLGRADRVALLIAPYAPGTGGGVDLLVRAHELRPEAKRVLLIGRGEWSSDHPAARALILGQIDHYLFLPWAQIERWLHRPVTEFLAEWEKTQPPPVEIARIVGSPNDERSHELREVFARIGIPFGFYAAGSESGRRVLARAGQDGNRLPVLAFDSGPVLADPTFADVARMLGFPTTPRFDSYDVVILGAGPTGLAATVYASSEGLRTVVVDPGVPGGQAGTSSLIRNYLGFSTGISGEELTNRALEQGWLFGAEMVLGPHATGLQVDGRERVTLLSDSSRITARTVIVAQGVTWRPLGVPSVERLRGAGVFYGAGGSEARALAGEPVLVVGGGNSAGQAAVHLARYAGSVTMVVRGPSLGASMSAYLAQEVAAAPNISVRLRTEVVEAQGAGRLERVVLRDRDGGATERVDAAAMFVMIGAEPRTQWLDGVVARDAQGYVVTGHDLLADEAFARSWPLARPPMLLETSAPGVFAAGDVRHRSIKRVASAVGEGAVCVQLVHQYLADERGG